MIKKENSKSQPLIDVFGHTGKVIEIEKGRIDDGIKKAIKSHALKNKSFKEAISENFQFIILRTKKAKSITMTAGIIFTGLSVFAGYKYLKMKKDSANGSHTNINSTNTESFI